VASKETSGDTDREPVVFVVEDDDSVRESLRRLLASEGLAVRTFANAHDFLAEFERCAAPSCLVLDVFLPGLSGLGLQSRLAEFEAPPAIVFLTGQGDISMSVRAINIRELENVIERALVLWNGGDIEVELDEQPISMRPLAHTNPDDLQAVARTHILRVLDDCRWVIGGANGAAARLGMKRTTLNARLKKLGIMRL
jgi:DNA-binding NtrC family response regulator